MGSNITAPAIILQDERSEKSGRAPIDTQSSLMKAPKKQPPGSRAAFAKEPVVGQGAEGAPATFGQKIFIFGLYLYILSLVWLTLSHHWYGVLPKWLDPH
jgi:hypothetical protein